MPECIHVNWDIWTQCIGEWCEDTVLGKNCAWVETWKQSRKWEQEPWAVRSGTGCQHSRCCEEGRAQESHREKTRSSWVRGDKMKTPQADIWQRSLCQLQSISWWLWRSSACTAVCYLCGSPQFNVLTSGVGDSLSLYIQTCSLSLELCVKNPFLIALTWTFF
jgi:hypothetical protein